MTQFVNVLLFVGWVMLAQTLSVSDVHAGKTADQLRHENAAAFEEWRSNIPDYERRMYQRIKGINSRTVRVQRFAIFVGITAIGTCLILTMYLIVTRGKGSNAGASSRRSASKRQSIAEMKASAQMKAKGQMAAIGQLLHGRLFVRQAKVSAGIHSLREELDAELDVRYDFSGRLESLGEAMEKLNIELQRKTDNRAW